MSRSTAVIGLGANLGEPAATFRWAIERLGHELQIEAVSALYQTAPVGPVQPDFLNAALRCTASCSAQRLLQCLMAAERAAGRERRERWGPRCLDLDLLWMEGMQLASPELTVPHPRLCERAFALYPLLEVAPDACEPQTGLAYRTLESGLATQRVLRLTDNWL